MRYFVSSNCLKCNVSSNSDEGMLTLINYRNFCIISIKINSQIFLSPFSLVHVKTSRPQYVGRYGQGSVREAVIQGYYTNHSLRATSATCGLEKGIPDKFIMERTGHRNVRSLQQHQKPTAQRKVEILKAFDLPLGDKVNSYSGKASVRKEVSKRETAGVEIVGEIEKKVENY